MLKPYINRPNSLLLLVLVSNTILALGTDKQADFILDGDNFKNLPVVIEGETQMKFWGNVSIEQGTLKINADDAMVYNDKEGVSKVVLSGNPVHMKQFIDVEYGEINVKANKIDYRIKSDLLYMTGDVVIKSKVQGEMHGEKITMNLKTKEISGEKSENQRVRLILKPSK